MQETDEMREARYALQQLTTETPAALDNMTRYIAALSLMLSGRSGANAEAGEPNVQAGFRMTLDERNILMAAAARLDKDIVHLGWEPEDGTGDPHALMVIRNEADEVACYPSCELWTAPGSTRAVIIPINDDPPCHFVFKRGAGLERIEGWPKRDVSAGLKRARASLQRIAASNELDGVGGGAFRHQVGWNGGFEVKSHLLTSGRI